MKALCAMTLTFEAIVVLLAIPMAIVVYDASAAIAIPVGVLLFLACLVLAGMFRRVDWAVPAGWVLQVLIVLTGFVVPAMFFLGLLFMVLWYYAIRVGRRTDEIKAQRQQVISGT